MADIVQQAEAGVSAVPGDVQSIQAAVGAMSAASTEQRARWGANARAYYESTMAPEVGAGRMMQVLRTAAQSHHAPVNDRRGARQPMSVTTHGTGL